MWKKCGRMCVSDDYIRNNRMGEMSQQEYHVSSNRIRQPGVVFQSHLWAATSTGMHPEQSALHNHRVKRLRSAMRTVWYRTNSKSPRTISAKLLPKNMSPRFLPQRTFTARSSCRSYNQTAAVQCTANHKMSNWSFLQIIFPILFGPLSVKIILRLLYTL
jgi:hypothetical protein